MAPASGDQQLAARRPPQSPMTDVRPSQSAADLLTGLQRSVRRRTPSPASRRYVLPDRYVPSRSIVFARDDYPNVYRPPPFPCRRDSRSPARCDDPTKASPMKGTPRRSRPATPPRDRPKARRPDIMLASRMSDNPRTDSWAESYVLASLVLAVLKLVVLPDLGQENTLETATGLQATTLTDQATMSPGTTSPGILSAL